jgi:hypothetical protein
MNSSLNAMLDSEKRAHEVTYLRAYSILCCVFCFDILSSPYLQEEMQKLLDSRDILDKLYRDASVSLTTLERSHHFTMSELKRHRDELKIS